MLKKFGMAVLAVSFLLPLPQAKAEQVGVYLAPKFVLNVQHTKWELNYLGGTGNDSKTGARAGGAFALGYDFAKRFDVPFRAELEYGAYGHISKTDGDNTGSFKAEVGFQTLLLNAYYDFGTFSGFTPYVGGGVGMAILKTEGVLDLSPSIPGFTRSHSETKAVFAGQIGLGCSYAFTEHAAVDLGYRFLMMGNGQTSGELLGIGDPMTLKSKSNYAHQFMMGLRFTF